MAFAGCFFCAKARIACAEVTLAIGVIACHQICGSMLEVIYFVIYDIK